MSTVTVDVERLSDDTYAAEFAWDNSHDHRAAMEALAESLDHYVSVHGHDEGMLPDAICGPASSLFALGMLLDAVRSDNPITAMLALSESQHYAAHALDHGDRIAQAVFGGCGDEDAEEVTLGEVLDRAQSWIVDHLPTPDPDAFLASEDVFASLDATPPAEDTDAA